MTGAPVVKRPGRTSVLPPAPELAALITEGDTTLEEIADTYGVALGTVTGRMHRGGYSPATGLPTTPRPASDHTPAYLALSGDFDDQPWAVDALCAQIGGDFWFPDKDGTGEPGQNHARQAKKICAACPVRNQCLAYAIDHDERYGIWGGLSERERRSIKKTTQPKRCAPDELQPNGRAPDGATQAPEQEQALDDIDDTREAS